VCSGRSYRRRRGPRRRRGTRCRSSPRVPASSTRGTSGGRTRRIVRPPGFPDAGRIDRGPSTSVRPRARPKGTATLAVVAVDGEVERTMTRICADHSDLPRLRGTVGVNPVVGEGCTQPPLDENTAPCEGGRSDQGYDQEQSWCASLTSSHVGSMTPWLALGFIEERRQLFRAGLVGMPERDFEVPLGIWTQREPEQSTRD
jgi:hypothetical protein